MDTTETTIQARRIEPLHDIRDAAKLAALMESMESDGWIGRPILAYGDPGELLYAVTGSHRIAAAAAIGIEVPVLVVEFDSFADADEFARATDDDDRLNVLIALAAPAETIELMTAEVASNYAQED